MIREVKEFFSGGKRAILLVVGIILLIAAIYFSISSARFCGDIACFKNAMQGCSKATFTNEQPEATWAYSIEGKSGGECLIAVKIVQAKEGSLSLERLQGNSMECSYPLGVSDYPEKDLSKCHGRLREDLQEIIIDKLHSYIIQNLGNLTESFNSF